MLKKITLFFIVFIFLDIQLLADEKEIIIQKLNKINSIKFNFVQTSNNKREEGICLLKFPKRLKCIYNDKNQKELIINNKTLVIMQKRYNKTYYYSIVNSPFEKKLEKKKLLNILRTSKLNKKNEVIIFENFDEQNQILNILFNEIDYSLLGWEMVDKFNNNIIFLINIISTNKKFSPTEFKIPRLN